MASQYSSQSELSVSYSELEDVFEKRWVIQGEFQQSESNRYPSVKPLNLGGVRGLNSSSSGTDSEVYLGEPCVPNRERKSN